MNLSDYVLKFLEEKKVKKVFEIFNSKLLFVKNYNLRDNFKNYLSIFQNWRYNKNKSWW